MYDLKIFKSAKLLRLEVHGWGNTRKADLSREAVKAMIGLPGQTETPEAYDERVEKARKQLGANKRLVSSKAYQDVVSFQASAKNYLAKRYTTPFAVPGFGGWMIVKNSVIEEVDSEVERLKIVLNDYVDKFIAEYAPARQEASDTLGDLFNVRDYPTEARLRNRFSFGHQWIQLDVPEGLPPELREREEAKLRQAFADAESAITGCLWGEFKAFVDRIQDRLTVGEDEKRKIFRDTLFEDLVVFVESFNNRNTFDDARLSGLVDQAKSIIAKVGGNDNADKAQRVREFEQLRAQTAEAFAKLAVETEKAIGEEPSRAFKFDED